MINGQRYTILPDVRKEIALMTKEEAIARIKNHIDVHRYQEQNAVKILEALNMAIKALEGPERKKGTWIILIDNFYGSTEATCSECGFEMLVNEPGNGLHDVSDLHYCPNCGADMRGEEV